MPKPLLSIRGILILDGILLIALISAPALSKMLLAFPFDCWVQNIGFLCPACGGTRSVILLFQGSLREAFVMNPYFILTGVAVLLGLIILHIACFYKHCVFIKISRVMFHPYSAVVWGIGFMIFGFLRNFI